MEDDSKLTVIKKQTGSERNMTQKYQRKIKTKSPDYHTSSLETETQGKNTRKKCRGEWRHQLWTLYSGGNYSVRGLHFIKDRILNWLTHLMFAVYKIKAHLGNSFPPLWSFRSFVCKPHAAQRVAATGPAAAAAARHGPTRLCFYPSPLHAASIWGRSRFSRTWRQISICPPRLNSSGSISKAAESQPFIALSAIQYHKVRSFGAGNLTALNSSKTELQWRAHNIMSLTRKMQREAARSCGAQTPPSSLAWQRGVSLKCVCVTAQSKHPSLVARADGFNKESFTEIPVPPSFLPQLICWFLCHPFFCQPFILLLCLFPVRPVSLRSGWCRAGTRSVLPSLFLYLESVFFYFCCCRDLCLFLRPQTGRSGCCFFLQFFWDVDSSVWAENNDSTYRWSEATTHVPQIASWAIFFLVALSFSAMHQAQTAPAM